MLTYRQLKRKKEFYCIKAIGERLDERDFKENNPDYKPIYHYDCFGNLVSVETEWVNKTYWFDIWYLFDLLNWIRMKKYTL